MATEGKTKAAAGDKPKRAPQNLWPKRIHLLYSVDDAGKLVVHKATRKAEAALAAFDDNRDAQITSIMVD